jgi:hypothetical protein
MPGQVVVIDPLHFLLEWKVDEPGRFRLLGHLLEPRPQKLRVFNVDQWISPPDFILDDCLLNVNYPPITEFTGVLQE